MTRDEFDALVDRLQRRYAARPFALRLHVAWMVVVGYAAFLFSFLLVFALGGFFFFGAMVLDTGPALLSLGAGSFLWTMSAVQAIDLLWVRIDPARGRALEAHEAPLLFDLLDRLRASLKAAKLERVVITPDFNAGAQQIPRLGVFGWPRNFLLLGLPLMECLAPEEFEALLGHELAHLSARHGRFGCWIYRLRQTWERVFQRLHETPSSSLARAGRRLIVRFIDWYWPRFNACAFVLAQANEYEADRFAGQWASPPTAAATLWRIECHALRLADEFWPGVEQLAGALAEPPDDLLVRMGEALRTRPGRADQIRWAERVARRLTDHIDTHPAPADRLRALGCPIDEFLAAGFPGVPTPTAAETFLGDALDVVRRDVNRLWRETVAENWHARHGRAATLRRKLTAMETVAGGAETDPELLWDKARSVLDLEGPAAAEPLLRQLLAVRPTHSAANLVLGRFLLARGECEGERYLSRILDEEEDELVPHACEALAAFFQSAGMGDRLLEVRHRLSAFQAASAAAQRERAMVLPSDRFVPHGLPAEELAALSDLLVEQEDLASAHLVRKELQHFRRQPLFVLCVRSAASRWQWSSADRDAALVRRLVPLVKLPGRVLIIPRRGPFAALARQVSRSPDARVL